MSTSRFQSFFDQALRVCERALYHADDIFVDYTGADQDRNRSVLSKYNYFVVVFSFFSTY